MEIAELQSIFTEKVLEQAEDIERVHVDTVASTENINMGNQEIRKAIQNKASYRVHFLEDPEAKDDVEKGALVSLKEGSTEGSEKCSEHNISMEFWCQEDQKKSAKTALLLAVTICILH